MRTLLIAKCVTEEGIRVVLSFELRHLASISCRSEIVGGCDRTWPPNARAKNVLPYPLSTNAAAIRPRVAVLAPGAASPRSAGLRPHAAPAHAAARRGRARRGPRWHGGPAGLGSRPAAADFRYCALEKSKSNNLYLKLKALSSTVRANSSKGTTLGRR